MSECALVLQIQSSCLCIWDLSLRQLLKRLVPLPLPGLLPAAFPAVVFSMSLHSFQLLLLFSTVAQSQARIQAICAAKPFCLVVDLMVSAIREQRQWQGRGREGHLPIAIAALAARSQFKWILI